MRRIRELEEMLPERVIFGLSAKTDFWRANEKLDQAQFIGVQVHKFSN